MAFPLKEVVAAITSVVIALLGYRQWKRSHRSVGFLTGREAAYKTAWAALEEIHLYVRSLEEFTPTRFDELVRTANTQMLRNSLYMAQGDRLLAEGYIDALRLLGRAKQTLNEDSYSRHALETTAISIPVPHQYQAALRRYEDARAAVVAAFGRAVGAGQI